MSEALATRPAAAVQELVDDVGELLPAAGSLPALVEEFTALPASPHTRRSYRTACRAFLAWLIARHGTMPDTFTARALAEWREHLIATGAAPASVAVRLTAVRRLAAHLQLDPAITHVRATTVTTLPSPTLTDDELARLLSMPDLRTRRGRRDAALLHLLASCGLRRTEACALNLEDIREVKRARDPSHPLAVASRPADRTGIEIAVRHSKHGHSHTVPLNRPTRDALQAWYDTRPVAPSTRLLISLPRGREPGPLTGAQVGRIVGGHAQRAGLGDVTPHVLRHTFCTMLAERETAIDVIQALAGHADIRTTARYIHTNHERKQDAVDALARRPHPLQRP